MPDRRELLVRRFFTRIAEERRRRGPGVEKSWHIDVPPGFIDYWTEVPATYPEKLVFAELIRRKINFYFSYYMGDLPITPDYQERIRPDFFLPDYKMIIEVYGVYWHSREGSFQNDAYRAMLLIASGFNYHILNDYQVITNVKEAIDSIPELRTPQIQGGMHIIGERPFNPNAAVKARMSKYPKVGGVRWRTAHKSVTTTKWQSAGRFVAQPIAELYPVMYETFPELAKLGEEWGKAYQEWLEQYESWAEQYEAWREAYYRFFGVYP